jgi:hypothetical protein
MGLWLQRATGRKRHASCHATEELCRFLQEREDGAVVVGGDDRGVRVLDLALEKHVVVARQPVVELPEAAVLVVVRAYSVSMMGVQPVGRFPGTTMCLAPCPISLSTPAGT